MKKKYFRKWKFSNIVEKISKFLPQESIFLHFGHFQPYLVSPCRFFDFNSPKESVPVANKRSVADNFILFWYVPSGDQFFFFDGLITDVTRFFEWVTNNKDCFIYQYHILHVMLKQKGGSHHLSLEIRIRARQIVAWYRAEDYRSEDTVCDDEHFLLESSDFEFCNLYIYRYVW